jgi:hypothetical protein
MPAPTSQSDLQKQDFQRYEISALEENKTHSEASQKHYKKFLAQILPDHILELLRMWHIKARQTHKAEGLFISCPPPTDLHARRISTIRNLRRGDEVARWTVPQTRGEKRHVNLRKRAPASTKEHALTTTPFAFA